MHYKKDGETHDEETHGEEIHDVILAVEQEDHHCLGRRIESLD